MPSVEWFGFVAGGLITVSFVPQVIRVFKLKSAHEISLIFTILSLTGITCWLAYGIFLRLTPVILWNSIGIIIATLLLYAKLKYGR